MLLSKAKYIFKWKQDQTVPGAIGVKGLAQGPNGDITADPGSWIGHFPITGSAA